MLTPCSRLHLTFIHAYDISNCTFSHRAAECSLLLYSYYYAIIILLVCACPVYHCVICVYAIRSLDCNFPINTYLLTYLLMVPQTSSGCLVTCPKLIRSQNSCLPDSGCCQSIAATPDLFHRGPHSVADLKEGKGVLAPIVLIHTFILIYSRTLQSNSSITR